MPNSQSTSLAGIAKADDILDRQFRTSYFKQLVGQFRTSGGMEQNPDAQRLAEEIASKEPTQIEWDDVYQLELALIKLEPEIQLRRHAWSLRSEYENIAPKEYQKYLKSKPPDPETAQIDLLRADLVRIQEELNWYYTVLWVQESFRSLLLGRITRKTASYILVYFLAGIIVCMSTFFGGSFNIIGSKSGDPAGLAQEDSAKTNHTANTSLVGTNGNDTNTQARQTSDNAHSIAVSTKMTNSDSSASAKQEGIVSWERGVRALTIAIPVFGTYWLVVFSGTLGALISVLRRIQSMSLDGNSDSNLVQLEQSSSSIYYSPLLGAVFALLVLFLFMGGLLSGSLFPKSVDGGSHFFLSCVPHSCIDLSKLIIWCFIAGFAEKFIPDQLDKLQKQSDASDKSGISKKGQ